MSSEPDKAQIFKQLKKNLARHAKKMSLVDDDENSYYLNTLHIMKNKKPLFFAAVQIKKNYVSYHLMPVYVNPDLLKPVSADLKKKMQGKSCFNFKSIDKVLFAELDALTKSGFEHYKNEGYV